ncbi:AI-2E family transporter [Chiayiivirga flava]|uniref:Putative PurR-regulated permease PerM n=1 Tax=Chiayiivirga flava TaxID=659595 RepID=A0A7W8G0L9_9GAMM|nr:AI-2E family transporter [Chiayiivirga flava]MBB5209632.1 putative PurR-regulated permease PerM [Chiayiivirga flava]
MPDTPPVDTLTAPQPGAPAAPVATPEPPPSTTQELSPRPFARSRSAIVFIAVLLALATCYVARDLIVPVLISVFLALCGNPIVARLNRMLVPRWVGSLAVVSGGLAAALFLGSMMLTPAADWLREAPSELRQHIPKLRALAKPLQDATRATESLQHIADDAPQQPAVRVLERPGSGMLELVTGAPRALGTVLAVTILWFFFMVYAEDLLRRFVTVVPGWRRKRVTVDILRAIQLDISRYVLTVSVINTCLGIATGLALWGIGLPWQDALLWGAVCGLFNFAPYIGPLLAAVALCVVGLVQFDTIGEALLAPGAFLFLHLIEGQIVTPLILGRRMAISPVILLLWLFLWGWMWSIAGLLLAVPMLVCFKIYCSRVESLRSWALMMEP